MTVTDRTPADLDTVADLAGLLHPERIPFAGAAGMVAEAVVAWEQGHADTALALLRRAVACADRTARDAPRALPRLALAAMLTGVGRFAEAHRAIDESGISLADELDGRWLPAPAIFRSRVHLAEGRLDDAVANARTGIELAAGRGACAFLPIAWLILAAAALDRDDLSGADDATVQYQAAPPPPRAGVGWTAYAWIHARLLEARDGPHAGFEALRAVYDDLDTHQRLLLEEPAAAAGLVRLALNAGDRARATAVANRATRLAGENPEVRSLVTAAAHSCGVLARNPDELEVAVAGHRRPWARASAAEDAGVVLTERGAGGRAPGLFDRALDEYERAGAVRDAGRVRARLRDLGIRRQHGRRRRRPVEGWESLTDTERRVAELVAEGLTNQQTGARMFVSRHTVDFHLRQIFRKLTITSRVELAGIALGRAADPRDRGMRRARTGATLPSYGAPPSREVA